MKCRKQNRHPFWDYSRNGAYFVTICTQDREHFFGEIVGAVGDGHGRPVQNPHPPQNNHSQHPPHCQQNIAHPPKNNHPQQTPHCQQNMAHPQKAKMQLNDIGKIAEKFWAEIPQHFPNIKLLDFVVMPNHLHGIIWIVGDGHGRPVHPPHGRPPQSPKPPRSSQKIPTIISQYKSSVTRFLRQNFGNHDFAWHRSYHDRIIRNDDELAKIRNYILTNPERWHIDRNNLGGIWI